jgi:hypothetical protein
VPQATSRNHFGRRHPLATVARQVCVRSGHQSARLGVGVVACGACWERVLRDDERVVVLFDLPRELERDPLLVDDIAVERACRGESVPLTAVERAAAVERLVAAGLSPTAISRRLRLSGETVHRLTGRAAA